MWWGDGWYRCWGPLKEIGGDQDSGKVGFRSQLGPSRSPSSPLCLCFQSQLWWTFPGHLWRPASHFVGGSYVLLQSTPGPSPKPSLTPGCAAQNCGGISNPRGDPPPAGDGSQRTEVPAPIFQSDPLGRFSACCSEAAYNSPYLASAPPCVLLPSLMAPEMISL